MPNAGMSKWLIGEPMIEWCERNGLDATRIVDSEDAFDVGQLSTRAMCTTTSPLEAKTLVTVWQRYLPEEDRPRSVERLGADGAVYVKITTTADSEPPLNPEWLAMFPDYDGPGQRL